MKKVLQLRYLYRYLSWALAFSALLIAFSVAASEDSNNANAGKAVYKKANCVGCHKWHGDGGGGYGGLALSLRKTQLDRAGLKQLIRCGRPGTRMPYHDRKAYQSDDRSCYDSTKKELGEAMPPRAHHFLREKEVNTVIDYVVNHIQGKDRPNYTDCAAFWGSEARQCKRMQKRESQSAENP